MSKYQKIREIVRETMKDGKLHTAEELQRECEKKGIEVSKNRTDIYNIVHQLKKKGEILADKGNGYVLADQNQHAFLSEKAKDVVSTNQQIEDSMTRKLEFEDFEIIKPAIRREKKQFISVFDNGDIALNGALCKVLKTNKVEIHIKTDCSQIILVPGGRVLLDITKSNRIKNYIICEKLEKKKVRFPVYYVGEWDDEEKIWKGDLVLTNPNKTMGKVVK